VHAVGVGELPELGLDQIEEGLAFVGRPIEVLRREGIHCALLDTELVTPIEQRLGGLRALMVAAFLLRALFGRVPTVPVLDHGDVSGRAVDLAYQQPLVGFGEPSSHGRSHRR